MMLQMAHAFVVVGILALTACGTLEPSAGVTATPPTLPGPLHELPNGVVEGASWVSAGNALPEGLDPVARYATQDDAFFAVTEPFGRRPRLARDPPIEGHLIDAPAAEFHVLVTILTGGDDSMAGEQFLLILRERSDGWHLADAWKRALCHRGIDHALCV